MSILKSSLNAVSRITEAVLSTLQGKHVFYPPKDPQWIFKVAQSGVDGIEILIGPSGKTGLAIDKDKLDKRLNKEGLVFDPAELLYNSASALSTGTSKQKLEDQTKLADDLMLDLMKGHENAILGLAKLEPIVALPIIKKAIQIIKESLSGFKGTEKTKRPITDSYINALLNIYIPSGMKLSLTTDEVKAILAKVDDYNKLPPAFVRDHVLGNGLKIPLSAEYVNDKLLPIIGVAGTSTIMPKIANPGNPTDKEMSLFSRGYFDDPAEILKFFREGEKFGKFKQDVNEDVVMEVFLLPEKPSGDNELKDYINKLEKILVLLKKAESKFTGLNGVLRLYGNVYENIGNTEKSNKIKAIISDYDKKLAEISNLKNKNEQERIVKDLNNNAVNQVGLLIASDLPQAISREKQGQGSAQTNPKAPKYYRELLDVFIDLLPLASVQAVTTDELKGKRASDNLTTSGKRATCNKCKESFDLSPSNVWNGVAYCDNCIPKETHKAGDKPREERYFVFLFPGAQGFPIQTKGETKKAVRQRLREYKQLNVTWDMPSDVRAAEIRRGGSHAKPYVGAPEEELPPVEPGGEPGEKVAVAPGVSSQGVELPREIPLNPAMDNSRLVKQMGLINLTHSQYIGWQPRTDSELGDPLPYRSGDKRPSQMMPYELAPGLKGAEALIKQISSPDPDKGGRGVLPRIISLKFNTLAKQDLNEPDNMIDIDDVGGGLSKSEIDFLNKVKNKNLDLLQKPKIKDI